MPLTRRTLLKGAAASLTLPRIAVAEARIANGTLSTISDGNLSLPKEFFFSELPQDELAPILAAHNVTGDTLEPPCNVTLTKPAPTRFFSTPVPVPNFNRRPGN